jgi:beta-lactamase regulating signal transducer with metallopeptidase domain
MNILGAQHTVAVFANSAQAGTLLISALIKSSIVFVLAACAVRLLGRSSAALRHIVWSAALAAGLALPLLLANGPAWQARILPSAASGWPLAVEVKTPTFANARNAAISPISTTASKGRIVVALPRDIPQAQQPASTSVSTADGAVVDRPLPQAVQSGPRQASGLTSWNAVRPYALGVALLLWLTGFMAVISRWMAGRSAVWVVARRASVVTDKAYLDLMEQLSAKMHITRKVDLLMSEDPGVPFTFGVFKSGVILPADCNSWDMERRRIVLTHELAHVKRRDCLVQAMAQITCGIYWMNPLVWLAAKKLRIESERACDDWVLADGTRASDYADHLVKIARSIKMSSCPEPAALMIARPSQLQSRLESILDPKTSRNRTGRAAAGTVAAMALLAIAPLAAIRPVSRAADAPTLSAKSQAIGTLDQASRPAGAGDVEGLTAFEQVRASGSQGSPENAPGTDQTINAQAAGDAEASVTGAGSDSGQTGGSSADGRPLTPAEGSEPAQKSADAAPEGQAKGADQSEPSEARRLAAEALTEALKDPDLNVREQAISALANVQGAAITEAIEQALKDSDRRIREQAAHALGLRSGKAVVPYLLEALRDSDEHVREQAAWGLGLQGDATAIGPLVQALKDSSPKVQAQAAWALGLKGDNHGAVEGLIGALKAEDARVREQAAWALGLKGDKDAILPLVSALKDSDARVREQAAWALGLKGDERAIPGLKGALKDPDQNVRRQAAWALGMRLTGLAGDVPEVETDTDVESGTAPHPEPHPQPHPQPHPVSVDVKVQTVVKGG